MYVHHWCCHHMTAYRVTSHGTRSRAVCCSTFKVLWYLQGKPGIRDNLNLKMICEMKCGYGRSNWFP